MEDMRKEAQFYSKMCDVLSSLLPFTEICITSSAFTSSVCETYYNYMPITKHYRYQVLLLSSRHMQVSRHPIECTVQIITSRSKYSHYGVLVRN